MDGNSNWFFKIVWLIDESYIAIETRQAWLERVSKREKERARRMLERENASKWSNHSY